MKKYLLFCLVIVGVIVNAMVVNAATCVWKGTTSTDWNTAANWSTNTVPTSTDIVQIGVAATFTNQPSIGNFGTTGTCSTLTLGNFKAATLSIGFGTGLTVANAITINSGSTITISFFSTFTLSGATFNNAGMFTATFATITFSSNNANLTNSGYFTASGGSTIAISGNTSVLNNSGTFYLNGSTFNLTGTPNTINNSGTFVLNTTGITLSKANSAINNTDIFRNEGSDITFSTTPTSTFNSISNSGVGATFHSTGSTITLPTSAIISNATPALFTADSTSVISIGDKGSITNTGIFNAGTSNSPCSITSFAGNASVTQTMITNTGTFNVGSTSVITIANTKASKTVTVANTSPGVFTLESDQNGSASIGQSGSTGTSFTGTYNVQRYIRGGSTIYRSYRLLSSPVNLTSTTGGGDISLSYLNTNANIVNANAVAGTTINDGALTAGSGGISGGFTIYNFYPTLYLYRESNVVNDASFLSGKYLGISALVGNQVTYVSTQLPSNVTVSIPVGNGYLMYFIGNNASINTATTRVPEATTLTATGMLNQQSIPVTIGTWSTGTTKLSYTAAFLGINNGIGNGLGSAGFNLVGNPYASVIDLKVVYSDNSGGFTNFYELNDINPSQGYVSYNGKTGMSSSTALSSEYIASGQGFIVQATNATETITFKEDEKVYNASGTINSSSTPPIFLTAPQRPAPALNSLNAILQPAKTRSIIEPSGGLIGLHLMLQQSSSIFRECGIYFNKNWSDNYDSNDAYDLGGGSLQMSSFTADGVRAGINALGDYTKGKSVKLYVQAVTDGNYNLNLEDIANIDTTAFNIYIVDHKIQDSLDIVHNKTYAFTIINADTTSYGANRLTLNIDRKPLPPYQLISFTGQKVKDGVQLTWKTSNEGDYTGFGIQKLDESKQYTALYNVQSNGDGTYTYIDRHPVKGNNTYRLQQINIDSLVSYSKPLDVLYHGSTADNNPLIVYPNPVREQITVNFSSTTSALTDSYLSCIYNAQGKLVLQQTATSNTWTQDVSALKPGAYVIQVKTASGNSIGNAKFVRVP